MTTSGVLFSFITYDAYQVTDGIDKKVSPNFKVVDTKDLRWNQTHHRKLIKIHKTTARPMQGQLVLDLSLA